jgi:hypothetical protein
MAAIDAVRYPICSDRRLLPPLNLNLHLSKAHHHVLAHHLTAVPVLLTRAAPVIHLHPNDFHHNTSRMKRTRRLRDRRWLGNHFRVRESEKSAIAGEHSLDAFASLATGTINVFATTVAGEHSFDAFASLAAGAFEVFATGAGAPLTVPAFFATAVGKAATAVE